MEDKTHTPQIQYRNLLIFSFIITLLINLFYILIFFLGKNVVQISGNISPYYFRDNFGLINYGFISTFIYTFLMGVLNFHLTRHIEEKKHFLYLILLNIAATILLTAFFSWIHMLVSGGTNLIGGFFLGNLIRYFLISIITVFVIQVEYLMYKKQEMALDYEKLSAENVKTRYEALKNQIDPHFLFNSFGTLKSLIKENPDKAEDYVQKLSLVFRYTLQDRELISLKEELEFTKAYCDLMLIRYGENLQFKFQIDEKYQSYSVIPISVQTLVENAIKHNVISEKMRLTIVIYTNTKDEICVSNLIQAKRMMEPTLGIGLKNLNERYYLKFKRTITIRQTENKFAVLIPLLKI